MFDKLPLEIVMMIFQKLSYKDLGNAMLVCSDWKNIIEDPSNWKKLQPKTVFPEQVETLLKIPRLCHLESLVVKHDKEELIELEVREEDNAPKYTVHKVRKMETANIESMMTPRFDLDCSQLLDLNLSSCDLTPVDADILSDCLNNMTKLTLISTQITVKQLEMFFSKMSTFTNIERLEFNLKTIEDVFHSEDTKYFGDGLNKVKNLTIQDVNKHIHTDHLDYFFQKMGQDTDIEFLKLVNAEFVVVTEENIAQGLNNINKVHLSSVTLTNEQVKSLFKSIKSGTKIKELHIESKLSNVNSVESKTFGSALIKIPNICLNFTYLTEEQLTYFFSEAQKKKSKFENLDLSTNNLSKVSEDLIAGIVENSSRCLLRSTDLTPAHLAAIAKQSLETLDELDVSENDFNDSDPIVISIIANSVSKMNFSQCKLGRAHIEKTFELLQIDNYKGRLRNLDLQYNACGDLSKKQVEEVSRKIHLKMFKMKIKLTGPKILCSKCGKGPFVKLKLHKCKIN